MRGVFVNSVHRVARRSKSSSMCFFSLIERPQCLLPHHHVDFLFFSPCVFFKVDCRYGQDPGRGICVFAAHKWVASTRNIEKRCR